MERLLTFDELTPQNCGNKGYRLALMQKLVNEGKLKDITIPKGFVIPEGYINRLKEYINVEDEEESKDRLDCVYTQEVEQKVKELGMTRKGLIVRSNFNTEDLGSFSSAGIYDSKLNWDTNILETTLEVADNIDYKKTKYVHQKYRISDKQIQPAVIVQDAIDKDYAFTVYSDDGDGNAIIQLTYKVGFTTYHDSVIKYNKKTKKLTLDNNMSPKAEFILDEKENVVAQHHERDRIAEEWDTLKPLLGIVISGASELEKFFNHPQDIEGGVGKDGKVYFWQTRDIVAKGKKRI